jgi:hypothetical protein
MLALQALRLFREKLAKVGLIEKLFDRLDQDLAAKGYMARGGRMVDATIVPVPTQRNSRDENEAVKAESTRRADKRAPRRRQSHATDYRSALVAITRRTGIVRGALIGARPRPIAKAR